MIGFHLSELHISFVLVIKSFGRFLFYKSSIMVAYMFFAMDLCSDACVLSTGTIALRFAVGRNSCGVRLFLFLLTFIPEAFVVK